MYQNTDIYSSTSPDSVYVNFSGSNNGAAYRSNLDPPPHYANVSRERSSSHRSNTVTSTVDGHNSRPRPISRQSSGELLDGSYYPKPNNNENNGYLPRLPPRQTISVQSPNKNHQRNT